MSHGTWVAASHGANINESEHTCKCVVANVILSNGARSNDPGHSILFSFSLALSPSLHSPFTSPCPSFSPSPSPSLSPSPSPSPSLPLFFSPSSSLSLTLSQLGRRLRNDAWEVCTAHIKVNGVYVLSCLAVAGSSRSVCVIR